MVCLVMREKKKKLLLKFLLLGQNYAITIYLLVNAELSRRRG